MINSMKQNALATAMIAATVAVLVSLLIVPAVVHGAFPYGMVATPAMPNPLDAKPVPVHIAAETEMPAQVVEAKADAAPKHTLTGAQISAILGLLRAFGADEKVIASVAISLN